MLHCLGVVKNRNLTKKRVGRRPQALFLRKTFSFVRFWGWHISRGREAFLGRWGSSVVCLFFGGGTAQVPPALIGTGWGGAQVQDGHDNFVVGPNAKTDGCDYCVVMGPSSEALVGGGGPADNSVILGLDLRNFNPYSVNIGSSGLHLPGPGLQQDVSGTYSTAIGHQNRVGGNTATAIGAKNHIKLGGNSEFMAKNEAEKENKE